MTQLLPDAVARQVEKQADEHARKLALLKAEREVIDDQIAAAERELNELDTFVRVYRRLAGGERSVTVKPAASDGTDEANGQLGRLEGKTLAEAAQLGLRFLGGEAKSAQLREVLVERGALKPNHNSYAYLLKVMASKPESFVKVERGRWALTGEGLSNGS